MTTTTTTKSSQNFEMKQTNEQFNEKELSLKHTHKKRQQEKNITNICAFCTYQI